MMVSFDPLGTILSGFILFLAGLGLLFGGLIGQWWGGLVPGGGVFLFALLESGGQGGGTLPFSVILMGAVPGALAGGALHLCGYDPATRRLKLAARVTGAILGGPLALWGWILLRPVFS